MAAAGRRSTRWRTTRQNELREYTAVDSRLAFAAKYGAAVSRRDASRIFKSRMGVHFSPLFYRR